MSSSHMAAPLTTVGSTALSCCSSSSSPVHSFSHQAPFFGPPAYKIPQVWVSDPSEPQAPQCTGWALSSFPKVFICLEHHGERERKAGTLHGWSLTSLRTGVPHLGALKLPMPVLHPHRLRCSVSGLAWAFLMMVLCSQYWQSYSEITFSTDTPGNALS